MAVAEKVKAIIVEQLGVDEEEVTADASFVDDLGADSLDTVELVMAFEEEFGIEIPDEDAEKITRVKEAVEYIEAHAKGQEVAAPRDRTACARPDARRWRQSEQASRRHRHRAGVLGGHRHRGELGRAPRRAAAASGPSRASTRRSSPTQIAGEVKGFDPLQFVEKKDVKKMDIFIQYAMAASQFAMDDCGLAVTPANADRVGVFIASGIGGFAHHRTRAQGVCSTAGPGRSRPFFIPSAIINLASGQVSIRFGAKGPNSATCTACSASAHAIGDAFEIIKRGDADAMIAGGSEAAITPMGVGGFGAMRALSTRNDDAASGPAGRSTATATASSSAKARAS